MDSSHSESGPYCSLISKILKRSNSMSHNFALLWHSATYHQDGIFSEAQQALNCIQLGIFTELCEENVSRYRCPRFADDLIMERSL